MVFFSKLWTINFGYHLARRCGDLQQRRYARRVAHRSAQRNIATRSLDFSVAMLVGRASVTDACRSLTSLATHVGQPRSILIASDGTIDQVAANGILTHAGLACPCDFHQVGGAPLGLTLSSTTAAHPMVKKLTLIADLIPAHGLPMLYVDSDVIFFAAAERFADAVAAQLDPAYMVDKEPSFDPRLIDSVAELASPANGGFLWFPRPLNWDRARDRMTRLGPAFGPTHFTEQTAVHLAMHDSGGIAFDPARFVLSVTDQFEWRDRFANQPNIVCRHYVRPVRHKMWMLPLP